MKTEAAHDSEPAESAWAGAEALWIASLALLIILPGYQFGPAIIRFFGRGGRTETVEWLVYLLVLPGLPIAAFIVARVVPRVSARLEAVVKAGVLLILAAEAVVYLARSQWRAIGAAVALSIITVAFVARVDDRTDSQSATRPNILSWVVPVLVGTAAWMSAGTLVSWSNATEWFLASAGRFVVFLVTLAISILAMRATFRSSAGPSVRSAAAKILIFLGGGILLALSFRTNPVLELYHWEAYVGPMQELRQGGWLLWDAPAQYGVLSILIPTLFPGNAWQSFYLFQALCNAVVALLMFWALAGTRWSASRIILATGLTATTLFFRPRSATLLLAGQMTPSGGPVRFMWPFVILAFLFSYYSKSAKREVLDDRADWSFELRGHLVWLASVCWSVEAAIYCSAVWFPAYVLYLMRRASHAQRSGRSRSEAAGLVLRSVAVPVGALVLSVGGFSLFYRVTLGYLPDWMAYFEYALLYSGGFRSLPIDPSGSVWFLLIIFLSISTAAVFYLFRDPVHPRVMVLAGAWGGVWAISSYFVSRSHAANLLSIATFLVFAAAITLRVIADQPPELWHGLIRVAFVPMFVAPVVLTVAHPAFGSEITKPQLSYGSFTEQIPLMEPSLNQLLIEAGAKPTDAVVRIGDGRLMLPAWRPRDSTGTKVVSPYSWLPKQYEIIGTLPPDRRRKYIDRIARHLRLSGWLIHSKAGGIPDFDKQLSDIQRTHVETRRFENKDWIVSWYEIKQ
ncbi:MAG: hypothetical protein M3O61_01350 [Gemmatimonadota bacterium]|nr:hypothetical protein [Gemmatimonadota bacterium]